MPIVSITQRERAENVSIDAQLEPSQKKVTTKQSARSMLILKQEDSSMRTMDLMPMGAAYARSAYPANHGFQNISWREAMGNRQWGAFIICLLLLWPFWKQGCPPLPYREITEMWSWAGR